MIDENDYPIRITSEAITKLKEFEEFLLRADLINDETRDAIKLCRNSLLFEMGKRVDKHMKDLKK